VICGLFIASWTNSYVKEVWSLRILNGHTPEPYKGQGIWFCLGAFQIVAACTQVHFLQTAFATQITQYLGSIFYALYLTHDLCLTVLEPQVAPILDEYFSKGTIWGKHLTWIAGLVIYWPVIICVSYVFGRVVDNLSSSSPNGWRLKCVVAKTT
jgi:peptidoglycan/LPS O-acetylase OafA/YrhL